MFFFMFGEWRTQDIFYEILGNFVNWDNNS